MMSWRPGEDWPDGQVQICPDHADCKDGQHMPIAPRQAAPFSTLTRIMARRWCAVARGGKTTLRSATVWPRGAPGWKNIWAASPASWPGTAGELMDSRDAAGLERLHGHDHCRHAGARSPCAVFRGGNFAGRDDPAMPPIGCRCMSAGKRDCWKPWVSVWTCANAPRLG